MIHFTNPETEDPADSLKNLRSLLEHLISKFKGNYTPSEHLAIDEYLSLWKGRLSFRIYIPSKRERYGVKVFMLCESQSGYLLNFIIYTGATTEYLNPLANLDLPFDTYKSPSKVVLSLLHDYLNKGYCVTLDNYYTLPELAEALLLNDTDCYGTLRKKSNLPDDFWFWKPARGSTPQAKFEGNIGVMRWNDVTKTKKVKYVSMLSTVHKTDRNTGVVIQKPDVILDYNKTMGGVDLVSRVLIPYSSQRRGVKWYRKLAELFIDISVYNSFILWKKMNPQSKIDHLKYHSY